MIDANLLRQIVKYRDNFFAVRGVAPTNDFSFLLEKLEDGEPTGNLITVFAHDPLLSLLPVREPGLSWRFYVNRYIETEGVI